MVFNRGYAEEFLCDETYNISLRRAIFFLTALSPRGNTEPPRRGAHVTPLSFPYLQCKGCQLPIALPHPKHKEKRSGQSGLTKDDWMKMFARRECGHVYLYTARDVHQDFPPKGAGTEPVIWVHVVEGICGGKHCKVPSQIRIAGYEGKYARELILGRKEPWTFEVDCPNGHRVEIFLNSTQEFDPCWWE